MIARMKDVNPALRAVPPAESGSSPAYQRGDSRGDAPALEKMLGRAKPDEHLVSLLAPATFEAEQYRTLGLMLEQRRQTGLLQVVAMASPTVGDGKTLTAINLAGAVSQSASARVLLMDVDFRKPSIAAQLGLRDNVVGLRDAVLNAGLRLKDVVRRHPAWNLSIATAGRAQGLPHEIIKSARFAELLNEARRDYEWIILDTAPLMLAPDCLMLGRNVDGFLMVVYANKTSRQEVAEALNSLGPSKLLGLVYNGDDRLLSSYNYGAYYMTPESG
jgi:capsular exopolysaccharide synthesis family protein